MNTGRAPDEHRTIADSRGFYMVEQRTRVTPYDRETLEGFPVRCSALGRQVGPKTDRRQTEEPKTPDDQRGGGFWHWRRGGEDSLKFPNPFARNDQVEQAARTHFVRCLPWHLEEGSAIRHELAGNQQEALSSWCLCPHRCPIADGRVAS